MVVTKILTKKKAKRRPIIAQAIAVRLLMRENKKGAKQIRQKSEIFENYWH